MIRLIAPTTSDERLPKVLAGSSGFVYYVSITGITGTRTATAADLARDIPRIRRATSLPIAVGFGVRTPEHAATIAGYADAAIVASALIEKLCATNVATVLEDVAALAAGLRTGRLRFQLKASSSFLKKRTKKLLMTLGHGRRNRQRPS